MSVQFTDVVLNMGNVGDFVASFFVDLSTIYAGTFTAIILVLFRVKGIVMPAKKKGSSASTRNERRRELRKSFAETHRTAGVHPHQFIQKHAISTIIYSQKTGRHLIDVLMHRSMCMGFAYYGAIEIIIPLAG